MWLGFSRQRDLTAGWGALFFVEWTSVFATQVESCGEARLGAPVPMFSE